MVGSLQAQPAKPKYKNEMGFTSYGNPSMSFAQAIDICKTTPETQVTEQVTQHVLSITQTQEVVQEAVPKTARAATVVQVRIAYTAMTWVQL